MAACRSAVFPIPASPTKANPSGSWSVDPIDHEVREKVGEPGKRQTRYRSRSDMRRPAEAEARLQEPTKRLNLRFPSDDVRAACGVNRDRLGPPFGSSIVVCRPHSAKVATCSSLADQSLVREPLPSVGPYPVQAAGGLVPRSAQEVGAGTRPRAILRRRRGGSMAMIRYSNGNERLIEGDGVHTTAHGVEWTDHEGRHIVPWGAILEAVVEPPGPPTVASV